MQLVPGLKLLSTLIACGIGCTVQASTVWDEDINGDFANSGLAPTSLIFALGSNSILGTTGDAGQGIDRDYFSFTIPDGAVLSSLMVLSNTSVSGSSSFIGIQAGTQVTVLPTGAGAQNLLGFSHYGNDQIGTDILPNFTTSTLPSGTYSVWVQELGGPVSYGFDFGVTPVPLPGAAVLLLSGLLGLATQRRRGSNVR